jgi:hypothetical protein
VIVRPRLGTVRSLPASTIAAPAEKHRDGAGNKQTKAGGFGGRALGVDNTTAAAAPESDVAVLIGHPIKG